MKARQISKQLLKLQRRLEGKIKQEGNTNQK
jgi:hypothetical protein